MNCDTGEIKRFAKGEQIGGAFIPIEEQDATKRQMEQMRVSLHDHISKLGKQLTKVRYERAKGPRNRSKYVPHIGKKQLAKQTKE